MRGRERARVARVDVDVELRAAIVDRRGRVRVERLDQRAAVDVVRGRVDVDRTQAGLGVDRDVGAAVDGLEPVERDVARAQRDAVDDGARPRGRVERARRDAGTRVDRHVADAGHVRERGRGHVVGGSGDIDRDVAQRLDLVRELGDRDATANVVGRDVELGGRVAGEAERRERGVERDVGAADRGARQAHPCRDVGRLRRGVDIERDVGGPDLRGLGARVQRGAAGRDGRVERDAAAGARGREVVDREPARADVDARVRAGPVVAGDAHVVIAQLDVRRRARMDGRVGVDLPVAARVQADVDAAIAAIGRVDGERVDARVAARDVRELEVRGAVRPLRARVDRVRERAAAHAGVAQVAAVRVTGHRERQRHERAPRREIGGERAVDRGQARRDARVRCRRRRGRELGRAGDEPRLLEHDALAVDAHAGGEYGREPRRRRGDRAADALAVGRDGRADDGGVRPCGRYRACRQGAKDAKESSLAPWRQVTCKPVERDERATADTDGLDATGDGQPARVLGA